MTISEIPLVSICSITFNHGPFIRKCLDGFVMQKTSFPFEVLIHDDASKDGAEEIIREYQAQYPDIIKPLYEKENQWSQGRRGDEVFNFPRALGKYIAVCEGDDYWTDPNKLQKQIDFLESNPDFSICFHKVKVLESGRIRRDTYTRVPSQSSTVLDLARYGNYIHTCSCVFRNSDRYKIVPKDVFPHDYAMHLFNSKEGEKIWYINEAMAVYRIHAGGILRGAKKDHNIKNELKFYAKLVEYFPDEVSTWLLFRFFLVYTRHVRGQIDPELKQEYTELALSLVDSFDENTLTSIVHLREEIEYMNNTTKRIKNLARRLMNRYK